MTVQRERKETGDPELLSELIKELEVHIKKRGAGECLRIMDQISLMSWPEDLSRTLNTLTQRLKKYQFKEAMKQIESIKEKLN